MIFVTADTHGEIERFEDKQLKKLKKNDTLIVLGDFGFIWNDSEKTERDLKKLAKQPYRILFIDGLNENFPQLMQYPETKFGGAHCREIVKDKIYYIPRGTIITVEDKKLLCFGGCDNYDVDIIVSENDPTQQDFNRGTANVKLNGYAVDYILTHMPSGKINRFINLDSNFYSETMDFFDMLAEKVTYTKWYFGCLHMDKYISPKVQAVYTDVLPLWEEEKKKGLFGR
ncbi:MAG: metallophosphoesterase [Oscillospiraceae bacterium]|nr:metallophosphoesterase [Oscillospiraceae bacterium]